MLPINILPLCVVLGLSTFAGTALAICNDGEVGVGSSQLCGSGSPVPGGGSGADCGGNFGHIFANNCGSISGSTRESFCEGKWGKDGSVNCNSNGDVVTVDTSGGRFGWCYKRADTSCSKTIGISSIYINVEWCCKRL